MSDDPNRPDADHDLEVDISAFLPEGSRVALDDDEIDDTGSTDSPDATDAFESIDATSSTDRTDGNDFTDAVFADAAADDQIHTTDTTDTTDATDVFTTDIGGVAEVDDGWETGAPAPEIPEWARDGLPPAPVIDGADQPVDDEVAEPAPVADTGPAVPATPDVDTTVLTRIEGELADVDAAIAAIDAGDLARSPLLTELLAASAAPSNDHPN